VTASDLERYVVPARGLAGDAAAVIRPSTTDEVRVVIGWARRHRLRVIPQGANSGLVGASTPGPAREVVLRLPEQMAHVLNRRGRGATLAEIGRGLGLPDPLSTARAVRALIARRRLEAANGSYRLLDPKPLDAGERESIGRRPRRSKTMRPTSPGPGRTGGAAYSDLGRAVVDKLVDLGREAAELRAESRTLREEARDARAARDEAERRARSLGESVRKQGPDPGGTRKQADADEIPRLRGA
jgi:hypothetical protein